VIAGRIEPSGLSGRAGIDLVVGDLPRLGYVNPHPRAAPVGRIISTVPETHAALVTRPIEPRAPSTVGGGREAERPGSLPPPPSGFFEILLRY
jgi:predicted ATP-grasp superfamily ATP-dependent carboligase